MATAHSGSDSDIEPSSDIGLAGSASVDLEPANVTSSGQRSLLDVSQSLTCLGKEEDIKSYGHAS